MSKRPRKKQRRKVRSKPKRRELKLDELTAILDRAKELGLTAEEHGKLAGAVDTLAFLTAELELKGASIRKLRRMLFGPGSEKTSVVLGEDSSQQDSGEDAGEGSENAEPPSHEDRSTEQEDKPKPRGHGRNGAASFKGADKVELLHDSLEHRDLCPTCEQGKVYHQAKPAVLVRVRGMAPLSATVYERERLRCNLCGEVFTAESPEGVGEAKYDESAAAMIALLKYGSGLPFYRLEGLQKSLGIPLPASTQWDLVKEASNLLESVHEELIRQAAQGDLLHNDDTTMKILEIEAMLQEHKDKGGTDRSGSRTSGIVALGEGHQIALFFTGVQHAGENLADVLARRSELLEAPIQMCDALSHNTPGDFATILANCLTHSRRKFVDVVPSFPEDCRVVLQALREVYRFDAEAKALGLDDQQRLLFHQQHSKPVMDELKLWLDEQIEHKKIESNSGLGQAIGYMRKHWAKLTLFLRQAGAPLDNNICERILKRAILHRKNSMFYKSTNGARVGDRFMALIHTAELNKVNPFDYLLALLRHHLEVTRDPGAWMPWNFREALEEIVADPVVATS